MRSKTMTDKLTYEKVFARMSGHFLAAHLPDDWNEWEEEKLDQYMIDNHWEPLEYWEVNDVYGMIDALAIDVLNLMGVDNTDQLL